MKHPSFLPQSNPNPNPNPSPHALPTTHQPQQHSPPPTTRSPVIPSSTIAPQCGGVNGPRTKTC
eukprot:1345629-Amorphochlora_amoeboformis.AAC.1